MNQPLAERIRPQAIIGLHQPIAFSWYRGSLTQQIAKGLILSLILYGNPRNFTKLWRKKITSVLTTECNTFRV